MVWQRAIDLSAGRLPAIRTFPGYRDLRPDGSDSRGGGF